MATNYNTIANLRYEVSNKELQMSADRYGIIEAVRELRMCLLTGTKDTIVKWKKILTGTKDGEIVMKVWNWLFGCYPTIVTEHDQRGFVINAWVSEIDEKTGCIK